MAAPDRYPHQWIDLIRQQLVEVEKATTPSEFADTLNALAVLTEQAAMAAEDAVY
jgi:hypothetical protein